MRIRFGVMFLGLLIIYFLFASYNLLALPLYLDEGLYIFWASLFKENASFAYVSMQDGKTPLFIWATYFFNQWFSNYLFTGRLISVFASGVTLVCSAVISYKIGGKLLAIFVWVLFLVTPFNLLISRMAFVDSLLIAFGSLSLVFLVFAREFAFKKKILVCFLLAFFSGLFLGLAFLTKTTARIFLVAEILGAVFWSLEFFKERKFKPGVLTALSILVITGLYFEVLGYLRIGALRYWEMIANKEAALTFTLPEIFKNVTTGQSFNVYQQNFPFYIEYLAIYFGPILVLFLLGCFKIFKDRKHFWLLIIVSIFIAGVILSAKIPASRYISIIIPEVLIVAAIGLSWVWKKARIYKAFAVILIVISFYFSSKLVLDPLNAIYASDDKSYFVTSEISANGLRESIEHLKVQKENSVVGVEGMWGVAEGMVTSFEEQGIETEIVKKVIPNLPSGDIVCEDGYLDEKKECWKADFGGLLKNPKPEKYIYLTAKKDGVEFLEKLTDVSVVKEFNRPEGGVTSYLIKLNP